MCRPHNRCSTAIAMTKFIRSKSSTGVASYWGQPAAGVYYAVATGFKRKPLGIDKHWQPLICQSPLARSPSSSLRYFHEWRVDVILALPPPPGRASILAWSKEVMGPPGTSFGLLRSTSCAARIG